MENEASYAYMTYKDNIAYLVLNKKLINLNNFLYLKNIGVYQR